MKKFYAMFVAVLMSATLFAQNAPTAADLANIYDVTSNVVFCIQFIEDAEVCNDIRFIGTPNSWGKGEGDTEAWTNCEKFAAVPGFDGWYAAELPYSEGFQGKPAQEPTDGSFTWDYQCGDKNAWVHVDGLTLNITDGYADECNIAASAAGAYIYQLKYWKKHKSPCVAVVKHQYSITLYAPDACPDMKPAISGDDMGWGTPPVAMTEGLDDDFNTIYTYSFEGQEGHGFKIRAANDDENWSNQMQFYNDTADGWWNFDNIELTADSVIVLDWSDNESYRFALCTGEPIDTTVYTVIVGVNVPANAPAAGVELVGSWGEGTWDTGIVMTQNEETKWYQVFNLQAKAGDLFKIREVGTWDNQIVYVDKVKDGKPVSLDNFKFGDEWEDFDWKGDTVKLVELNLSDSTVYCWTTEWVEPQGIENVVLTEKAQKVMVDGVLYIIRDNKMYNLQGVMVRKD